MAEDEATRRLAAVETSHQGLTGLSVAELGDRWEHHARQSTPGVQSGRSESLRWLAAGEILAGRVHDRRGEAATGALMAGATVEEIAAAMIGPAAREFRPLTRGRMVRELVVGWVRDTPTDVLSDDQRDAILSRLGEATA